MSPRDQKQPDQPDSTPRQERLHDSEPIYIGKVTGCHGLQGALKISTPLTNSLDWLQGLQQVILSSSDCGEQFFKVKSLKLSPKNILCHLEELTSRTLAEPWQGATVFANKKTLPPLDPDSYWSKDLVGLSVIQVDTKTVQGKIVDVLFSGGGPFLEILPTNATESVIIPFIHTFFPTLDLNQGTIDLATLLNLTDLITPKKSSS